MMSFSATSINRHHLQKVMKCIPARTSSNQTRKSTNKELALVAFCLLQNRVNPAPGLRMLLKGGHESIDLLALVIVSARVHCHDDLHKSSALVDSMPMPHFRFFAVCVSKTQDTKRSKPLTETDLVKKSNIERLVEVEQLVELGHRVVLEANWVFLNLRACTEVTIRPVHRPSCRPAERRCASKRQGFIHATIQGHTPGSNPRYALPQV
jgi:hypothetical protein